MSQNRSGGADGVMYRRAKLWQIIMVSTSAFIGMGFYSLIGLANYTASIGYGIATVAVGGILTFTRIFDAARFRDTGISLFTIILLFKPIAEDTPSIKK